MECQGNSRGTETRWEFSQRESVLIAEDGIGHVQWGLGPSCSALWGFPELFRDEEWCPSHKKRRVYVSGGVISSKKYPQREAATGNSAGSHNTTTTTKGMGWHLNDGIISVSSELSADFSFRCCFSPLFCLEFQVGKTSVGSLSRPHYTGSSPVCLCLITTPR